MRLNLFSSRQAEAAQLSPSWFDTQRQGTEHSALTVALYSLLETLPHSYSGRENIKLLCHAILGATPHLRFVWVGFCQERAELVAPYAASGDCASEAESWELPRRCFDSIGPYSQARPQEPDAQLPMHALFTPWQANPDACTVQSALAIPLRSDKPGLRGMIVFYADTLDYFKHMGVPMFQVFCNVAEIVWQQSSLRHLATQQAQQDQLTGLLSRRQTMLLLEREIAAVEESGAPLSILMCRAEGFGKLNALYGYAGSDAILAAMSREIEAKMWPHNQGGRWTGVKFLYILPGVTAEQAEALANQLREHFIAHPVNVRNWSIRLILTVASATYSKQTMGLDDLILQASQNLLSAADGLPSP